MSSSNFLRPPDFGDIYFHAKEVRILFDFCTECNHTQQVFLTEFSKVSQFWKRGYGIGQKM